MAKKTVDNLLTQLHDTFGDDQPSPEIERLMLDMQVHMNQWDAATPEQEMLETAKSLAAELESEHPQGFAVLRKIISTLSDMGL